MKRIFYFLIYACALLATSSAIAQPGDPGDPDFDQVPDSVELAVLKDLYDSLGGANWTDKTNWPLPGQWPSSATSSDFGAWFGITVTNGDISIISLGFNDLAGTIPSSLGNLSGLSQLYLHVNEISGSIPSSLGNLSNLEWLWLDGNQLSGSIPASFGN